MRIRSISTARLVLLLSAVALPLAACAESDGAGDVSQTALLEQLASDAPPLILDVRTPEEFASGRVPGAVNVPHTELAARVDALDVSRDRAVVVYCESGRRARHAEAVLLDAGFARVEHLAGDMRAWRDADLPCEGC